MRNLLRDDQANLAFLRNNAAHIEAEVYATKYPAIQYPQLIPTDTSAPAFIQSVVYTSTSIAGEAKFINGNAHDIPNATTARAESSTQVHTAGIGYEYGFEEIGFARMMGIGLDSERAAAAHFLSEKLIDKVCWSGDAQHNFQSFISNSAITPANVAQNAGATSRLWANKTSKEIVQDINDILAAGWTATNQIELADTILLPPSAWVTLGTTYWSVDNGSNAVLMDIIQKSNLYTINTGKPLKFGMVRELETAGASSTRRMVAYQRDPTVVKMHLPMPFEFLPVQQVVLQYKVPGVFRLGGVDIRRPGAVRYRDGF